MGTNRPSCNPHLILIPVMGSALFILLYQTATNFYLGGSMLFSCEFRTRFWMC